VADAVLSAADFRRIAEKSGGSLRARKTGLVAARQATEAKVVETRWNGSETTQTARTGDWIVTNLTSDERPLRDREGHLNVYVIAAERFGDLYQPTGGTGERGAIYRAKRTVEVIGFPGGFDIVAPWGERQTAPVGYLIFNGDEVYGIHAGTFAATYEIVA
jgi:hypothetical protein